MRRAAPSLALLAVLTAGCTAEAPPSPDAGPTGPCAAERVQPPDGSQEQRLQGDLDGDGRTDEVVSWLRDGERVVQAWLATGENAEPEALFEGDLLDTGDVDGDGRDEVFAATGGDAALLLALDGCTLQPVSQNGQPFAFPFSQGPVLCRGGGVVEQLRRPTAQEAAQGTLVARRFVVRDGSVTDEGETFSKTDVRSDDLATADAEVLCP